MNTKSKIFKMGGLAVLLMAVGCKTDVKETPEKELTSGTLK